MTNPTYTHISYLIDRSGSMSNLVDDVIGGFNTFRDEQNKVYGQATITLAQFDDQYEYVLRMKNILYAKDLDRDTYIPRGSTALRDAIGRLIEDTGHDLANIPDDERPGKVIFVVMTDGYENASKNFTLTAINEMITRQEKQYNWKFLFMGANMDAIAEAGKIGVPQAGAMSYQPTSKGTSQAMYAATKAVASYSSGATEDLAFTDEDREEQNG